MAFNTYLHDDDGTPAALRYVSEMPKPDTTSSPTLQEASAIHVGVFAKMQAKLAMKGWTVPLTIDSGATAEDVLQDIEAKWTSGECILSNPYTDENVSQRGRQLVDEARECLDQVCAWGSTTADALGVSSGITSTFQVEHTANRAATKSGTYADRTISSPAKVYTP